MSWETEQLMEMIRELGRELEDVRATLSDHDRRIQTDPPDFEPYYWEANNEENGGGGYYLEVKTLTGPGEYTVDVVYYSTETATKEVIITGKDAYSLIEKLNGVASTDDNSWAIGDLIPGFGLDQEGNYQINTDPYGRTDPPIEESDDSWKTPVIDRTNTPPGSPSEGDRYLITATATGAWAGHEDELTEYISGSWEFDVPEDGDAVAVEDEDLIYLYDGTQWNPISAGLYLDDLLDVVITSPSNGEVLTYASGFWVNQAASGGLPDFVIVDQTGSDPEFVFLDDASLVIYDSP